MGGGGFPNTKGGRTKLSANTKSSALGSIGDLPSLIQKTVRDFFKGGSSKYNSFGVNQMSNGNTLIKMEKPGNVPGSRAVYYKEVDPYGKTIRVYKETYGPDGKLIHTKEK